MSAQLMVRTPGGQQHSFPLRGGAITLGRDSDCDLVLDYPYVSRTHARVERTRDGYVLVDAGSTNGVEVNGRRISEMQVLAPGDVIQIGDVSVVFQDSGNAAASTVLFRTAPDDCPVRCDSSTWQVWINGEVSQAKLSLQEFELLSLLASRYGKVCTRDEIGVAIWGRNRFDYNMLHRLVHRLKQKLAIDHGDLIASVPGRGYKIEVGNPSG
jgi:hypothetical protein